MNEGNNEGNVVTNQPTTIEPPAVGSVEVTAGKLPLKERSKIMKAVNALVLAAFALSACSPGEQIDVQQKVLETLAAGNPPGEVMDNQDVDTQEKGYYESKCGPSGLVEEAVDDAYEKSLITNGMGADEAREKKASWEISLPGINIVVVSPDRGTEVFLGARVFNEIARNDNSRYPSGCEVAIARDPEKGSEGNSLVDLVRNKPQDQVSIYSWRDKGDGVYGAVLIDPQDQMQQVNRTWRP
jgi:hypothetical protein